MTSQPNTSNTKCPKCESVQFELVEDIPSAANGAHSNYKYYYLRCSKCKTFLSAFDYIAVSGVINQIAKKIGITI